MPARYQPRPFWVPPTSGAAGSVSVTGYNYEGWHQVIASTTTPIYVVAGHCGTGSNAVVNVGVGGAGAESVVAAIPVWTQSTTYYSQHWTQYLSIPVRIDAGKRVSLQWSGDGQYHAAGDDYYPLVAGISYVSESAVGALRPYLASGSSTIAVYSGTAGTNGAWTELVASTAAALYLTSIGTTGGAGRNTATPNGAAVELGIGSAGSEVVIYATVGTGIADIPIRPPIRVPAGSRLALRGHETSSGYAFHVVYSPESAVVP